MIVPAYEKTLKDSSDQGHRLSGLNVNISDNTPELIRKISNWSDQSVGFSFSEEIAYSVDLLAIYSVSLATTGEL